MGHAKNKERQICIVVPTTVPSSQLLQAFHLNTISESFNYGLQDIDLCFVL